MAASASFAQVQALRPTYVYDRANILDAQTEATINNYCEAVDRNSTAEIVVVTLTNLDSYGGGSDTAVARNKIFNDEPLSGVSRNRGQRKRQRCSSCTCSCRFRW